MWLVIANQENHIVPPRFCQYYFCRFCNSFLQFAARQRRLCPGFCCKPPRNALCQIRNALPLFQPLTFLLSCKVLCSASPSLPAVYPCSLYAIFLVSVTVRRLPEAPHSIRNCLPYPSPFLPRLCFRRTKKTQPRGTAFSFVSLICKAGICRSFPSAVPGPSGPTASAPDPPKSRLRGASPSYSARSPGCTARCSSYAP